METCFMCVYKLSEADGYAELVAVDHRAKTVFPLRLPVKDCVELPSLLGTKEAGSEDSFLSCGGDEVVNRRSVDMVSGALDESGFTGKIKNEICVGDIPVHGEQELIFRKKFLIGSPFQQGVKRFFQFFVLLCARLFKGLQFFFRCSEFTPKAKMFERMVREDLFVAKTAGSFDGYKQMIEEASAQGADSLAEDDAQGGKYGDGSPLEDAVDNGVPIAGCEKINHALHGGSVTGLN